MRAFPADWLEYFDDTAVGNTAFDGAAAGFAGVASFVGSGGVVFFDSVVAGLVAGLVAAGAALAAHSVLRKSFHDLPPSVPADFAA